MKIGERVLMSRTKEVFTIKNIKAEWTSFPHGSGTNYNIYTLEKDNGECVEYNELDEIRNSLITVDYLKNKNLWLQQDTQKQIEENNKLIEKLN